MPMKLVQRDATTPRSRGGRALVGALGQRREQMKSAGSTAHAGLRQLLVQHRKEPVALHALAAAHLAKMPIERRARR
jgi:hypothetical protein